MNHFYNKTAIFNFDDVMDIFENSPFEVVDTLLVQKIYFNLKMYS
jgi:hypothetical protein